MDHFNIEFTKSGDIHDQDQLSAVVAAVPDITDLVVISHGWNNDKAEASGLYDTFFRSVDQVLGAEVVDGLQGSKFGVVRVFWPSKKFADSELIPGGGAASATAESDESLVNFLDQLKEDPDLLGGTEINGTWEEAINQAKTLIPQLDSEPEARRQFLELLRGMLDASVAETDDCSDAFFNADPEVLFESLSEAVVAPVATGGGGATGVGDGGAAGLGDLIDGVKAAARRLANFTTYYRMKSRAGKVGEKGLLKVLNTLRGENSSVRIHMVGHSFGGKLVTAACHGLKSSSPATTMTLLQAAFSHNGFAEKFDGANDGFYRSVVADRLVSGPLIITHTKNDRAVGIAYPLASRIARQAASAVGDENDPYGGLGRNGAQKTPEVSNSDKILDDIGTEYTFRSGVVYNLRADRFVKDHGDVAGLQIAYAFLCAVRLSLTQ